MSLGVAIVGCGLIGQKRAKALGNARLAAAVDVDIARAEALVRGMAPALEDWRNAVARADVDIVIISTLHNSLAEIARGAIAAGKHVLVEKPGARDASELADLPALAAQNKVIVRVGFNHRFHRAFRKARELVDAGALGSLMFLRARYGHGGRVGYDKEWRSNPAISGGGELIDQGVHLIDLARWFLGDFAEVEGYAHTYFWDMPVDDNAFLLLKTASRQVAHLHASCTEWKNTFSFEIYGQRGKLHIEGLGGSYGIEQLSYYKMLPEMGPPDTQIWQYPMADDSWNVEMTEFLDDIAQGRQPTAGLRDAIAALEVVGTIYRRSGYDHRA